MKILKTLSPIMAEKDILIWDVNADSVFMFTFLLFRKIKVKAFVTKKKQYVGGTFINVPIIGEDEAATLENHAVLIVPNEFDIGKIELQIEKCYYRDALFFNEAICKNTKNYIYGAGKKGEEIFLDLKKHGIEIEGFCVSEKDADRQFYMGKSVFLPNQIDRKSNVIIAVYDETARKAMEDNCKRNGLNNIYIDEFIDESILRYNLFCQLLDCAVKQKKKIYVYTREKDIETDYIENCLKLYGVTIDGYICKESKSEGIEDVYDLADRNSDEYFIIISERDRIETNRICNTLDGIGFSLEKHSYIGLQKVTIDYINEKPKILDPLLGHSVIFKEFVGIRMYGTPHANGKKILILGGSTSTDGLFRVTSWPEYLWRRLRKDRGDITIYNMAHSGDDVIKEFLRLIRDGWYLEPDLVISMSGFNSTYYSTFDGKAGVEHLETWVEKLYPGLRIFNGIKKEESLLEMWERMEKLIAVTSNSIGAKYLGYLQPIKMLKKEKSLFEYYCFDNSTRNTETSFLEKSGKDSFYKNLISIFDDKEGMYIDVGHYTAMANKILADIVYEDINSTLGRPDSNGTIVD